MDLDNEISVLKQDLRDVNESIKYLKVYEELHRMNKTTVEYEVYFDVLNEKKKEKKKLRNRLDKLFLLMNATCV